MPAECELQVSEDNLERGLQGCAGCDPAEKRDMAGRVKADKCLANVGNMFRGLVHLEQRVYKIEVWEIKQGELFGAVLGKARVIGLKSEDPSLLEFREEDSGGTWWGR